ncbi:unnamed protein product [Ostreobium quekettii]|uniref:Prefoldin subunit alpha n=1 Tax=Ostreobium quekettii TaxID=121088 RepID=A0A8S1JGE4_9CHLO|nr:unnamed protein product [Ostreobium quekettii]|eukprot:evm.model.scf_2315.4 EVM.evm.TU.scf_2315.4   scf_2315:18515-19009(-)
MAEGADGERKGGDAAGESVAAFDDRLRVDLARALDQQGRLERAKVEFEDLERAILARREGGVPAQLRTRVELGSGVYMQALAPDADMVYVNVGLGFHVECSWEDAERIAALKKEALDEQIRARDGAVGDLRARERLLAEGMRIARELGQAGEEEAEGGAGAGPS